MRGRLAALVGSVASLVACNPVVALDGSGDGADETSDATSGAATSGAASISTTTGGGPTAPSEDSADGESEAGAYEGDSGTGCVFTCPSLPGGGGGGVFLECDVWTQDCAEEEKCMPWANDGGPEWNSTRCVPLDPNAGQLGEPCEVEGSGVSGIDNCARGLMCWDVDADHTGVCASLCTGSAASPSCPNSLHCSMVTEALPLCVQGCDPLAQDCDDGEACAPELGESVCAPAGPAQPGEGCALDACAAGSVCIDGAAALDCSELACCASYCDPSAPACPPGASCVALADAPGVGVCALGR